MINLRKSLPMFLLMFFALTSCSNTGESILTPSMSSVLTQTPKATTTLAYTTSISPTRTPTKMAISATIIPTTSMSMDYLKELKQVTDKELKVLIEEPDQKCHNPGDFIPVKITYQNLTNEPLVIADYNIVSTNAVTSYGILFPVLKTTSNDKQIRFLKLHMGDAMTFIDFVLLQEIPQKSSVEVIVEYYLPDGEVEINGNKRFPVLPSGQYLFQFIYGTREFKEPPSDWKGIPSNQITICVID